MTKSSALAKPKRKFFKTNQKQKVHVNPVAAHLIQIQATAQEIESRIAKFMERKRQEIDQSNIRDFCRRDPNVEVESSCARIDSVFRKCGDSKSHLEGDFSKNYHSIVIHSNCKDIEIFPSAIQIV